jgi:hypothetical protein
MIPRGGFDGDSDGTTGTFLGTSLGSPLSLRSTTCKTSESSTGLAELVVRLVDRGGGWVPAGYNPFGYQITELGEQFLSFEGSLDSDIGRFLASVKQRKSKTTIQGQWLEIVRASKQGQSMRIYRSLEDFIDFCLKAGFLS